MEFRYSVSADRRRAEVTIAGEVDLPMLFAEVGKMLSDPALGAGFDILCDNTGVTRTVTPPELQKTASYLESLAEKLVDRRCAVVTERPESFGMGRMFSVYAERFGLEFSIFWSMDEAEQWLASPRR